MHHCDRCKQETEDPIAVIASAPEIPSGPLALFFCCWECAALWFNVKAGEILMPDLDSKYYRDRYGY